MSETQESLATYTEVIPRSTAAETFDMEENKSYGGLKIALRKPAASGSNKNTTICLVVTIVLAIVFILAGAAACIVFALQITNLKSENVFVHGNYLRLNQTVTKQQREIKGVAMQLQLLPKM